MKIEAEEELWEFSDVLVFGRMIFLSTPDDIIFGTAQGLRAALPRSIIKVGLSLLERELCAAETL